MKKKNINKKIKTINKDDSLIVDLTISKIISKRTQVPQIEVFTILHELHYFMHEFLDKEALEKYEEITNFVDDII